LIFFLVHLQVASLRGENVDVDLVWHLELVIHAHGGLGGHRLALALHFLGLGVFLLNL